MNGPALLGYLLLLALGFGVVIYLLWQVVILATGPVLILLGIGIFLAIMGSLTN